jgi:hypothetical protein
MGPGDFGASCVESRRKQGIGASGVENRHFPKSGKSQYGFQVGHIEERLLKRLHMIRARKPHLPHRLLKAAVFLVFFSIMGQMGSESPKPHLPHFRPV